MKKTIFIFILIFGVSLSSLVSSRGQAQKLEKISDKHGIPWGLEFLDADNLLFTQREGSFKVLNVKSRTVYEIKEKIPVRQGGQAGLLDVALDPQFSKNGKIYFTYSKNHQGKYTTALATAQLTQKSEKWNLSAIQDLFIAEPAGTEEIHYGSRLVVTDREIWMTVGDRNRRELAQDLSTHMGKLLRLGHEGKAVQDNPFVGQKNAKPEIWSYGHRNPQGLLKHPVTGEIWLHEHGPRGGDELNRIKKGANYGWPMVSYGREYWGPKISDSPKKEGIEDPVYQYTPSIAPCGLAYYQGSKIKAFQDSFLVGSLVLTHLNQIIMKDKKPPQEKRHFENQGLRIRDVIVGSDENVYFSVDAGEIWRVTP